jgi:hypothetical protein
VLREAEGKFEAKRDGSGIDMGLERKLEERKKNRIGKGSWKVVQREIEK